MDKDTYLYCDIADDPKWTGLYGSLYVEMQHNILEIITEIKYWLENTYLTAYLQTAEYSRAGVRRTYREENAVHFIKDSLLYNLSEYYYIKIAYLNGYTIYSNQLSQIEIMTKFVKICNRIFLFYYPAYISRGNFKQNYFTNFCKHNNLNVKEFTSRHDIINHFSTFEPFIIDNEKLYWLAPEQQNEEYKQVLRNEYILTYKL